MKKLIVLLLVIVAALGGSLAVMSGEWSVERSQVVAGTPVQVHQVVEDLSTWPDWSYWNKETDPSAEFEFSTPASGAGATWDWESEGDLGVGTMKVISSSVAEGMHYGIEMAGMKLQGRLTYREVDGGTLVTFASSGVSEGLLKLMAPLVDRFVGPSYESSLAGLDRYLKDAAASSGDEATSAEE